MASGALLGCGVCHNVLRLFEWLLLVSSEGSFGETDLFLFRSEDCLGELLLDGDGS